MTSRIARLGCLLVLGCGGPTTPPPADDGPRDDADATWHRDVRPIVEQRCTGCHAPGGIGPFSLEDDPSGWSDGPPAWAPAIAASVAAGSMPPWHAADDCHPIPHADVLPPADLATFDTWAKGGFVEGDPADFVARPAREVPGVDDAGPADAELRADAPYVASTSTPDDYHCLPLGEPFETDRLLRGIAVRPDRTELVHHAIVYRIAPGEAAQVDALDAATPEPGYPCFGGALPGDGGIEDDLTENLHTWVPGGGGEWLPETHARALPAGSRLVMQVHYNVLGVPDGQDPAPDHTAVALWFHDDDTQVRNLVETVGLGVFDLDIAPGDPESVQRATYDFGLRARVVGMMPHMHYLGRSLTVEAIGDDGDRRCVVDVPAWDFAWQRTYRFDLEDPFVLRMDDAVEVTCVYDNSAANQPVIDGQQLEPTRVTWGEGTLDEMCLAYALLEVPYGGESGCRAFEACHEDCPLGDGDCLVDRYERSLDACGLCAASGVLACAAEACGLPFATATACVASCPDGLIDCLLDTCRDDFAAYLGCQDAQVRDGTCNPHLEECGVAF